MVARSKQDRRKKNTTPAQKPAPQNETVRGSVPSSEIEEPAAVPSPKTNPARSRQTSGKGHGGMVRTSTLYLTAVLCLLLGTYLGTLLPAFRGAKEFTSSAQQSQMQQASSPNRQGAENADHLKALEEAARKNPQDLHAWVQLGNHYFDDNKPREAIRAYEHALLIKGDNPDVLTDMGIMYRHLGEFEQAAKIFAEAGKINPLHEQSRFNLGVVLFFDLQRKDEARKVWRELVGINPEVRTPDGALLRTMLDELR